MTIGQIQLMEEEAAESVGDGIELELRQIVPQVWILDNWCHSYMLHDVGKEGGQNPVVLREIFEQGEPVLEVANLLAPPSSECEPVPT